LGSVFNFVDLEGCGWEDLGSGETCGDSGLHGTWVLAGAFEFLGGVGWWVSSGGGLEADSSPGFRPVRNDKEFVITNDTFVITEVLHFVQDGKLCFVTIKRGHGGGYGCDGWGFDGGSG